MARWQRLLPGLRPSKANDVNGGSWDALPSDRPIPVVNSTNLMGYSGGPLHSSSPIVPLSALSEIARGNPEIAFLSATARSPTEPIDASITRAGLEDVAPISGAHVLAELVVAGKVGPSDLLPMLLPMKMAGYAEIKVTVSGIYGLGFNRNRILQRTQFRRSVTTRSRCRRTGSGGRAPNTKPSEHELMVDRLDVVGLAAASATLPAAGQRPDGRAQPKCEAWRTDHYLRDLVKAAVLEPTGNWQLTRTQPER